MQSLRVALPGVVQSFDPGPPATVSVLIATKELVMQNVSSTGITLQTQAIAIPLLTDVPILIPNAGGFSLTFPIQQGDECLVAFTDTPLDAWFQSGGTDNNPMSQRRHSLSDGVAIFGVRSTPRGIQDYSTDSVQLRTDDGTVVVELTSNTINVNAPTVNVNAENVTVTGSSSVTLGESTTIDGRLFLNHLHRGVTSGPSDSGPVV